MADTGENGEDPRVRALLNTLEDILLRPPARKDAGDIAHEELDHLFRREIVGGIREAITGILGAPEAARGAGPRASFGGGDFEEMIDRLVADALVRGKRTTGILEAVFNIVPGLSGR